MEIGIIGSGNIGKVLAKKLVALGHEVSLANSRGPETLEEFAKETGVQAVTTEQAAGAKDVIIVTVPEKAVPKLPREAFSAMSAIIIDTGNYYPSRDGRIEEIENGLTESEWVAMTLGHSVVKAFYNIVAPSLATRGGPKGTLKRICLSVAGDEAEAKQIVINLIDELGFDGIDSGNLSDSWRQQPGSPAYCHDLDKDSLVVALAAADSQESASYRAQADEIARPYF